MDTHHVYFSRRGQVKVEFELDQPPARLLPLQPDVEIETRPRSEIDREALQFHDIWLFTTGWEKLQFNRLFREMFDAR